MTGMRYRNNQGLAMLGLTVLGAALLGMTGGPGINAAWAVDDCQWTWMKGSSSRSQWGDYGTLGVAAATNTPGARINGVSWTGTTGALWLFGGDGFDSAGNNSHLNDLWKYDRTSGNWTWMKGSSTVNQLATYGTLGVPAAANTPGARSFAASWTDASGALWLFGGLGYDGAGNLSYLNDLWKYDPATGYWAWMKGSDTVNPYGVYGVPGTPAAGNAPGGRYCPVTWTDSAGALWLFGGYGMDGAGLQSYLNDLWKYDPATGNWTWVKGSNTINQPGTYGTLGVAAASNTPGAREYAVGWTDPAGMLWLFGGYGNGNSSTQGALNDLWKYDPTTGNWAWMKGADTVNHPGVYSVMGTAAADNVPGTRYESVSWTDSSGALWLFGGYGYDSVSSSSCLNDLWKYDRATGNWTWMKGSNTICAPGAYGTLSTPDPDNTPGSRSFAVSWTDPSGGMWLFGGNGYDGGATWGRLNDLWRWQDAVVPTGSIVINNNRIATKSVNVALSLAWDDGDGSGVTRMRFSSDGSTWTPWEALVHTRVYALPSGDGYKTVRVQYMDIAGNRSLIYNDYIRLDTVPPTGSILINGGASTTTSLNVALNLTWADVGAGVTRMRFSDNGSTWTPWETIKHTRVHTLPAGLGYHTVRVQYTDIAENYSVVYNDYIRVVTP